MVANIQRIITKSAVALSCIRDFSILIVANNPDISEFVERKMELKSK